VVVAAAAAAVIVGVGTLWLVKTRRVDASPVSPTDDSSSSDAARHTDS
jgi:hypothetical protein